MTVKSYLSICLLAVVLSFSGCLTTGSNPNVLVFTKTNGYRHASIEAGIDAIRQLGQEHGFSVSHTEDSSFISEDNLRNFAAVIFLNTSGDVLNNWQQADLQRFIEAGGGFVGIHGAVATEYDWRWYGNLVGAFFDHHPEIQKASITVRDADHPATGKLPATWTQSGEWYNFRPVLPPGKVLSEIPPSLGPVAEKDSLARVLDNVVPSVAWSYQPSQPFLPEGTRVLLALDEKSYKGGTHGGSHPIAWCREYEGGRSFYTGLGHSQAEFRDSLFLLHLLGGIEYAIGAGKLDYQKAKTHRVPPPDRFVRTVLASNLNEPTEMTIFPDGRVLFVERRGAIKLYDPAADTTRVICQFPVYDANEEGLMGVQLDPNWQENKWIYLFYSVYDGPKEPVFVKEGNYHKGRINRLSRFVFDDNMLHLSTEKILLEVPELVGCCHTGGSIDFDAQGNLFLSTGDNTNPFESDGFAPIDGRPGRSLWDARKSSASPDDLRGKILRIKPQPDGTYTIPEGNLFAPGTPDTRPEIFVMGCRNPYRISVDKKTGCVFWGDVGPDAGMDGPGRGSKGYDTWCRACEAGNYGWPLFRGNHIYHAYNFASKKSGPRFDPLIPVNDSPFNTGKKELPPLKSPFIWYSYDESFEFPWVGTGGKNPMAGPVYHAAEYPDARHPFPAYFEDKVFVYEWIRDWIFVASLDEKGNLLQADPFLPGERFSGPMDMAFGPDGALYVLEYGEGWFTQNLDARLNRIEYAPGNRRPSARIEASPLAGAAPLKVRFSAAASSDLDGDPLRYTWKMAGKEIGGNAVVFDHTFKRPGDYQVSLKVEDASGAASSAVIDISVGNAPPALAWKLQGNQSFYWDEQEIPYQLDVSDPEDGSLAGGTINPGRVRLSIDYLPEGKDIAAVVLGHQTKETARGSLQFAGGQLLIEKNDCKNCHDVERKVNGPSYVDIANRYYKDPYAVSNLSAKVITGGAGVWGETAMSAHPDLSREEAEEIVRYILSLAGPADSRGQVAAQGSFIPREHIGREEKGAYVFQASYRDLGREDGTGSLYAKETFLLRYPKLEAESCDLRAKGIRKTKAANASGGMVATDFVNGRHIGFSKIDLTDIGSLRLKFSGETAIPEGTSLEVRIGGVTGKRIGAVKIAGEIEEINVPLSAEQGRKEVYLVLRNEKQPDKSLGALDWIWFERVGGTPSARKPI